MYPMFVKVSVEEGNYREGGGDCWYQRLDTNADRIKGSSRDRWSLLEKHAEDIQTSLLNGKNFNKTVDSWNYLHVTIISEQKYHAELEKIKQEELDREIAKQKQVEANVKAFQYRQQVIASGLSKLTDEEIKFLGLAHLKKN